LILIIIIYLIINICQSVNPYILYMNVLNLPLSNDYNSNVEYSKKFKMKRLRDINIYITYINNENEIEIISRKKLYIENKNNTITRNNLVDVIKNFQRRNNISYKLISIMVYNINVTPETLSDYIERPEDFVSLFALSRIDSFELQSTISMLKEYNAMYFFFAEAPKTSIPPALPLLSLTEKGEKKNTTKRVYIESKKNNNKNNRNNKTKRYDKYTNLL
jgi:hypothetical protein